MRLGCLVLIAIVVSMLYATFYTETLTGTLIEKPVDGGETVLVFQFADGHRELFVNHDNIFRLKFNSRDIVMNTTVGQVYTIRVHWMRVPFLSWSRNILSVDPPQ